MEFDWWVLLGHGHACAVNDRHEPAADTVLSVCAPPALWGGKRTQGQRWAAHPYFLSSAGLLQVISRLHTCSSGVFMAAPGELLCHVASCLEPSAVARGGRTVSCWACGVFNLLRSDARALWDSLKTWVSSPALELLQPQGCTETQTCELTSGGVLWAVDYSRGQQSCQTTLLKNSMACVSP